MRVAVVGAGLAGLAAAIELGDAGVEVHVFERSRIVGGKVSSFLVDGVEVDNGQHVFLGCCTEFIDLVARLGMADRLWLQERFAVRVFQRGGAPAQLIASRLPAPLHLTGAFLRYRELGVTSKLRIAWALLNARRATEDGQTFGAWLKARRQDERAIRAFWSPFVVPALNAGLDEVSAEAALFVIRTAFLGDTGAARIGYSRVPLARIAEAAARRAGQVHLRRPVQELVGDPECVTGIRLVDGSSHRFDGVVAAVPPHRLQRLLGTPEAYGVPGLSRFRSQAILDVHLWYDIPSLGFSFATILDSPVQWVFEKAAGYQCCSVSAARAWIDLPETMLVDLCRGELEAAVPQLAGARFLRGATTRDKEATFVQEPGLVRPSNRTRARNLVVAGAWTDTGWPATMESAVRSGRAAARVLLEDGQRESSRVA